MGEDEACWLCNSCSRDSGVESLVGFGERMGIGEMERNNWVWVVYIIHRNGAFPQLRSGDKAGEL